jgi:hypothetical protein
MHNQDNNYSNTGTPYKKYMITADHWRLQHKFEFSSIFEAGREEKNGWHKHTHI